MKLALVFPVHNESEIIIEALNSALQDLSNFADCEWQIIVVENGSSDDTYTLASQFAKNDRIEVVQSAVASKGSAIRYGWELIDADVYCFSDIDQSINLKAAVPKLIKAFKEGVDVVTFVRQINSGSGRPLYRRLISKVYASMARILVGTNLQDLPCGMKAVSRDARDNLVPAIKNQDWFFDSELLLRAELKKYKIAEINATWTENRFSNRQARLPIIKVALQYLRALINFRRNSRP